MSRDQWRSIKLGLPRIDVLLAYIVLIDLMKLQPEGPKKISRMMTGLEECRHDKGDT
jgi:hypothetical protein